MDLDDDDQKILAGLAEGARTQKHLIEETGIPRYTIRDRLRLLAAGGYIRRVHDSTALYELADDPDRAPEEVIQMRIERFADSFDLAPNTRQELYSLLGFDDLAPDDS